LGELKTPAAVMRAVQGTRNPQRKSGSEKEGSQKSVREKLDLTSGK
jgi:hypothetical protein